MRVASLLVVIAACGTSTRGAEPPSNQASARTSLFPDEIDGFKATLVEDASAATALYVRTMEAPEGRANPGTAIAIGAFSDEARAQHSVPGWMQPGTTADTTIADRTYRGRPAQLIQTRYDCGDTRLGVPIDPSRCAYEISLAVRLRGDRVLLVTRSPAKNADEVFAIADGLDVDALEAAALKKVPKAP